MKWFGIAVNTNWDEKFIIYLIIYIYLEVIKKIDWNIFVWIT